MMPHRRARLVAAVFICCMGGIGSSRAFETTEIPTPGGPGGVTPFTSPFPVQPTAPAEPNFQYQVNIPPDMGLIPSPGWKIVPRISVFEEFNDNIFQSETDRQYDFVTLISPGVAISADTPRLNLSLNYQPTARIFARHPEEDGFPQHLLGVAQGIIVPDQAFVNATVFAGLVPTNGGFGGAGFGGSSLPNPGFGGGLGGAGALSLSKNNLSQVASATIFPYVIHRFGDNGTGKAGVRLTESYTSHTSNGLLNSPQGPASQSTTGEAVAQYYSDQALGRFYNVATVEARRSGGSGGAITSSNAAFDNQLGYFISPTFQVFGDLGYGYDHFEGSPPVTIDSAIWAVGASARPNQDSQITVSYGHRSGFNSFQARASYRITPRTFATVSYTSGLNTNLQLIERELQLTGINQQGNAINLNTGAPIFVTSALTGLSNTVFRNHTLTATATTLLDRDTLSLFLTHSDQTAITSAPGTANVGNTQTTVTGRWRHE
ncbi:MAG: hypothetical protein ACREF3_11080, partial [Acetobacteraceae bacterium]